MSRKHLVVLLPLVATLGTGCGPLAVAILELAIAGAMSAGEYGPYTSESVAFEDPLFGVGDATLGGDIGAVASTPTEARVTGTRYEDGSYAIDRLTVESYVGDTWLMVGLQVEGGLRHPSLASGEPLRFEAYSYGEPSEVYATAFACSSTSVSDSFSNVAYDQPAVAVTLVAHDDPVDNVRHVEATVELPDGQQATSTFVVPM